MRDEARHAGVDASTVSRALNESTRQMIGAETVERVLAAAQELGYRTNILARGLRTQRSMTIGILVPDLTNPFFPPIVRGIEDGLATCGCRLLLANTNNDPHKEEELLQVLLERQAGGLILATSHLDRASVGTPDADRVAMVIVGHGDGQPLEHPFDGLLRWCPTITAGWRQRRAETFREQIRRRRLARSKDLLVVAEAFTVDAGATACGELLDRGVAFSAIFAANDLIAIGCMQALSERGLTVPRGVSLVGYNGMPFVDGLQPSLTTVRVPQYEIDRRAATLLLAELDGSTTREHLEIAAELVVEGSRRLGSVARGARIRSWASWSRRGSSCVPHRQRL